MDEQTCNICSKPIKPGQEVIYLFSGHGAPIHLWFEECKR